MTVAAQSAISQTSGRSSALPAQPVRDRPWLAAVAIVPILATVYQTLVLTDVTDDVIRKGIDGEHYSMIWTSVCWGVAVGFWPRQRSAWRSRPS